MKVVSSKKNQPFVGGPAPEMGQSDMKTLVEAQGIVVGEVTGPLQKIVDTGIPS